ncbi:MAG: hypothetical protein LAO20_06985 [Acidobacteriia bacterium]|nr:hypothetical protein [Terriglobia bacterium]
MKTLCEHPSHLGGCPPGESANGIADLGIDLEEHIAFCIEAMKAIAGELRRAGTS